MDKLMLKLGPRSRWQCVYGVGADYAFLLCSLYRPALERSWDAVPKAATFLKPLGPKPPFSLNPYLLYGPTSCRLGRTFALNISLFFSSISSILSLHLPLLFILTCMRVRVNYHQDQIKRMINLS